MHLMMEGLRFLRVSAGNGAWTIVTYQGTEQPAANPPPPPSPKKKEKEKNSNNHINSKDRKSKFLMRTFTKRPITKFTQIQWKFAERDSLFSTLSLLSKSFMNYLAGSDGLRIYAQCNETNKFLPVRFIDYFCLSLKFSTKLGSPFNETSQLIVLAQPASLKGNFIFLQDLYEHVNASTSLEN